MQKIQKIGLWLENKHPLVQWLLKVAVFASSFIFMLAGLVMLVTPGPGLLTIFIGLALLGIVFPPAERLVLKIIAKATLIKDHILSQWAQRKVNKTQTKELQAVTKELQTVN